MATRGLGRGLDSLIPQNNAKPETASGPAQTASPVTVPIHQIKANHFQPRHHFNEDALRELSESIREQGVIQPLIVSPVDPDPNMPPSDVLYELIAGERRWRAAKMAGFTEVPVVVKKVSSKEKLQFSLIENIQREDLNPIEEAIAFKRLMEEFNLTQEELAKTVGKGRVVIANTLRLLHLPQFLQDAVSNGAISAGHARSLVSISDPDMQKEVAEKILRDRMSVRDVEKIVSDSKGALDDGRVKLSKKKDPEIRNLEDNLRQTLGTKVEIKAKGQGKDIKGTVIVSYFSLEDLERIVDILQKK